MSYAKFGRAIALITAAALLLSSAALAGKGKKKDEQTITEADLQADLMSYADRYASIVAQAIDDVQQLDPPPEVRQLFNADLVYAAAGALTIAADADPQVALLDMVVLGTLGRSVFEKHWRPRYGAFADPVVTALKKLELDAWEIADGILTGEQQAELRERIEAFRIANPELTTFSHLRFADFPSRRKASTLRKGHGGGIFKSVRRITEQVEQTRMLAERGVYLSTRLPLLAGSFADIWLSQLSVNPAVQDLVGDVHTFAGVSERLATVAEELPLQIAEERDELIKQLVLEVATVRTEAVDHLFESVAKERESLIEQLAAEEEPLTGVLSELGQVLVAGNELTVSAGALAEKLDLGPPAAGTPPAKPSDIDDYHQMLAEASTMIRDLDGLVGSAHQLLDSPTAQQLAPQLVSAIDEAGDTVQAIIDRVFVRIALLIVIALAGIVMAGLAYRWLAVRLLGAAQMKR